MNTTLIEILACLVACLAGFPWGRQGSRNNQSKKIASYCCVFALLAIVVSAGIQNRTPFLFALPVLVAGLAWLAGWVWEAFTGR